MNIQHWIDISEVNPDGPVSDWDAVKACGFVDGAIIRATYGLHSVDSAARQHMEGAKRVGLPYGFYHFFYPSMDATAQAEHFYDVVLWLCGGFAGLAVPWLDAEVTDGMGALAVATAEYTALSWWGSKIGNNNVALYNDEDFANNISTEAPLNNYKLVVASYGSNPPDPQAPDFANRPIPGKWPQDMVAGWQYSSKHLVPGAGIVDGTMLDVSQMMVTK